MNRREALAALISLPEITRIQRARLQPNDVIVLECDDRISDEMAVRIRDCMEGVWPGRKCVVLDKGTHLKVVSE